MHDHTETTLLNQGAHGKRGNGTSPVHQALCLSWVHAGKEDVGSSRQELTVWQADRCVSECSTAALSVQTDMKKVLVWEAAMGRSKEGLFRRKQRQINLGTVQLVSIDQVGPCNLPLGLLGWVESHIGKNCIFQESSLRSSYPPIIV